MVVGFSDFYKIIKNMLNIKYKKILFALIPILVFLSLSVVVFAETSGPSVPTIKNPLKSTNVQDILNDIMSLVTLVGSIIVVLFIIYSGYKFVTARGNPAEITKAKEILLATVIGGAILLGANLIARAVINTTNETFDTSY